MTVLLWVLAWIFCGMGVGVILLVMDEIYEFTEFLLAVICGFLGALFLLLYFFYRAMDKIIKEKRHGK